MILYFYMLLKNCVNEEEDGICILGQELSLPFPFLLCLASCNYIYTYFLVKLDQSGLVRLALLQSIGLFISSLVFEFVTFPSSSPSIWSFRAFQGSATSTCSLS